MCNLALTRWSRERRWAHGYSLWTGRCECCKSVSAAPANTERYIRDNITTNNLYWKYVTHVLTHTSNQLQQWTYLQYQGLSWCGAVAVDDRSQSAGEVVAAVKNLPTVIVTGWRRVLFQKELVVQFSTSHTHRPAIQSWQCCFLLSLIFLNVHHTRRIGKFC